MKKEVLKEPIFAEKILRIIRSSPSMEEMREQLRDYHDNDIAQSLKYLNRAERNLLYSALDAEWLAEIISYIDDPVEYVDEIGIDKLSAIINEMDADDAVDLWESIDESVKVKLRPMIDDQTKAAILLINSYDDDEVGSLITTNYICIHQSLTIRQAMHELVRQAGENDNIATIYVVDGRNRFCGAIDLKDLIVARENVPLDSLISYAYPYLLDHEKISDSIEKRLPWLIILLFLGMGVSTVVGAFEGVVAVLPVVICFQSLILDMAGNVGTQSLAVTIRVLMDENLSAKDKLHLVAKEMKVGSCNGALLGVMALVFLGVYIVLFKGYSAANAFLISGCVGLSLLAAIVISSLVGTLVPMLFHKVKIDPAVASGPLITTINDLVAVVTYYGLAWVFLIDLFHLV